MWEHVWAEVRHHPGRFVSTLLAVAISVAFLAGAAVLVETEGAGQARAASVWTSRADLVIDRLWEVDPRSSLSAVGEVASVTPLVQGSQALGTADGAEWVSLYLPLPEHLRWAEVTQGRWPEAADEIALSRGTASAVGVALGGTVEDAAQQTLRVVGLTDEPSSMFLRTGYAPQERFTRDGSPITDLTDTWLITVKPGADPETVLGQVRSALAEVAPADGPARVMTAEQSRAETFAQLTGNIAAFTYLLWGFAAVALVVGMITIANTFSITLAQRRRQIGLLRAVGASGAQVRRRFLAEALLLGLAGSLLGLVAGIGLAAAVTAWTGTLFWGLALPWSQLGIAFGLGVLATAAAAWLPILRGTRVHPLEALRPLVAAAGAGRTRWIRGIGCGTVTVLGLGLAGYALSGASNAFLLAVAAGALIALGVLFGAPLFVPSLIRISGRGLSRLGTVWALAAGNADRNPRRAAATATALMLAVGLIVTLQVTTASLQQTSLAQIEASNPVDLSVTWSEESALAPIPDRVSSQFGGISGVAAWVPLSGASLTVKGGGNDYPVTVLGHDAGVSSVTGVTTSLATGEILVAPMEAEQLPAEIALVGKRTVKLKVVRSALMSTGTMMVAPAVLAQLAEPVQGAVAWLSVPDRSRAVAATVELQRLLNGETGQVGGSVLEAAAMEQVFGVILAVVTGLLGVAVLIALIGVGNTLGLSVLERAKESALLRALGLQSRSLRWMLTVEALQVTGVGVVIGAFAGAGFGWLAVASLGADQEMPVSFAIDLPQTLGMIAIAVLAAALASVVPGRRAARVSPTQALAEE